MVGNLGGRVPGAVQKESRKEDKTGRTETERKRGAQQSHRLGSHGCQDGTNTLARESADVEPTARRPDGQSWLLLRYLITICLRQIQHNRGPGAGLTGDLEPAGHCFDQALRDGQPDPLSFVVAI